MAAIQLRNFGSLDCKVIRTKYLFQQPRFPSSRLLSNYVSSLQSLALIKQRRFDTGVLQFLPSMNTPQVYLSRPCSHKKNLVEDQRVIPHDRSYEISSIFESRTFSQQMFAYLLCSHASQQECLHLVKLRTFFHSIIY